MKKYAFVFIFALISGGCSALIGQQMYPPSGIPPQEADKQQYDCLQDARLTSHGNPLIERDRARECLAKKYGWSINQ